MLNDKEVTFTREGYEYYLQVRQRIIVDMQSNDVILDIEEQMSFDDYKFMGNVYISDKLGERYTEKQVARKLAEDQTYYRTTAETNAILTAIQNYWTEMNVPMGDRESFTIRDILYGTPTGKEIYNKYWNLIDVYYHSLRAKGMSGSDAKGYIGRIIFGSE